ncbi:MAG: hypothetical protein COU69_02420 [Candidatus Pacebacteria bacterium CG10_big_fil_rev_8_21_14_0_10_56_10]|nr:MAG: hypothetical protein COU69_02420 [Candidatus Pacebacteria bacterium CG10_big_fil_rev_8_21_14_0_10_56_10]
MKRNDITKLHQLSLTELDQRLVELREELALAQLKKHAAKLDNRRLPDRLADDVARVKTVISHHRRQVKAASRPTASLAANSTAGPDADSNRATGSDSHTGPKAGAREGQS